MRLAAIGYCNDTGVGRELVGAVRQLPFSGVFVLNHADHKTRVDLLPTSAYHIQKREVTKELDAFLDVFKPDVALTWDCSWSEEFCAIFKRKGIRWLNVVHWDWFNPRTVSAFRSAELISPTQLCRKSLISNYNLKSTYLPIPVDTDRIQFRERKEARSFISIYGHGGAFNRRSLPEIFMAWSEMQDPPDLTIKAQVRPSECDRYLAPPCVKLEVDNVPEPEDLYLTGDVAIQVSRYEGTGTCLLECMAAGLPVITTKGYPMLEIAPELAVEPEEVTTITLAGKEITSYIPSVLKLRELVEDLRSTPDVISAVSRLGRERAIKHYSWTALRPAWIELLEMKRAQAR